MFFLMVGIPKRYEGLGRHAKLLGSGDSRLKPVYDLGWLSEGARDLTAILQPQRELTSTTAQGKKRRA